MEVTCVMVQNSRCNVIICASPCQPSDWCSLINETVLEGFNTYRTSFLCSPHYLLMTTHCTILMHMKALRPTQSSHLYVQHHNKSSWSKTTIIENGRWAHFKLIKFLNSRKLWCKFPSVCEQNGVDKIRNKQTGELIGRVKGCETSNAMYKLQWNLSVTTTSIMKFITCELFSNVFNWIFKVSIYCC